MANERVITTKELMGIDMGDVVKYLRAPYTIVFSDKEVTIPAKELILNRIIWEVFKEVNIFNFSSKFNISNYYVNELFSSSSIRRMLEDMFLEVVRVYVIPNGDRSILNEVFYKTLPNVFSDINELIVMRNMEYISSIDILNFLEIQFKPELVKALNNAMVKNDPESIVEAYKALDNVMFNDPTIKNNPLRIGYVTKNFRIPQLQQMLACVGFCSETSGHIYSIPITTSYVLGLHNPYSVGLASRDSIKACSALGDEIRNSEYFSRSLQMVSSGFINVVDGDCGSTEYLDWFISDEEKGLKEVIGKYFLDKETNTVRPITKDDKHLMGEYVKLRHVEGCKHTSPRHCCFVCYGLSAVNYPYLSRIGHANAAEVAQRESQSTISQKHNVGNVLFKDFVLREGMDGIFKVFSNRSTSKVSNTKVGILPSFIKSSYSYNLHIDKACMRGVKDIMTVKNLDNINPNSISSLHEFYISITNKKDSSVAYQDVNISMDLSSPNSKRQKRLNGSFTTEFLKYMVGDGVNKKFFLDNSGKYVINIDEWDVKLPMFEFQLIQAAKSTFTRDMKEIVTSLDPTDQSSGATLAKFSNTLNMRFTTPLNVSEVLTAAFIVSDSENGDFSCGRGKSKEVSNLVTIMKNASLGGAYGFERHMQYVFENNSFGHNLNNHLLDCLICPQEVYDEEMEIINKYGLKYMTATRL